MERHAEDLPFQYQQILSATTTGKWKSYKRLRQASFLIILNTGFSDFAMIIIKKKNSQ